MLSRRVNLIKSSRAISRVRCTLYTDVSMSISVIIIRVDVWICLFEIWRIKILQISNSAPMANPGQAQVGNQPRPQDHRWDLYKWPRRTCPYIYPDDDDRDGHRNVGIQRTPNAADSPRRLYHVILVFQSVDKWRPDSALPSLLNWTHPPPPHKVRYPWKFVLWAMFLDNTSLFVNISLNFSP
jgi:hypothetical protein